MLIVLTKSPANAGDFSCAPTLRRMDANFVFGNFYFSRR
jgi:hypothetical protein